jgi:thioredoxin-like negative regulator of GroEL
MAAKSARRLVLEQGLADDPQDVFLRYGLAMQCLREGDTTEGRERLNALIADHPDDQIAAYQQLGQSYVQTEELDLARTILLEGIAKARARGDAHAAAEMQTLVDQIG